MVGSCRQLRTSCGSFACLLASAQREAWGVGGRGTAEDDAKSLRAVAGAEAMTICAHSRGFQIRAKT